MNLDSAIFTTIIALLNQVMKLLIPIILLIVVWVLFKILYNYFKYGKVEFDVFRKKEVTKTSDLVINMLNNIEGKRKIYFLKNFYSDLIIIDKTGLYLLKIIKYNGYLIGDVKDKKLLNKINLKEEEEIDNPLILLEKDKELLDSNLIIKTILVTSNTVNIQITNLGYYKIVKLKDFYFTFSNLFKGKNIYNELEIKNIYNQIKAIKK